MLIIQALLLARTEYVVYFLLSSWLETLERNGAARALPPEAKALPIRGAPDVTRRLAVVRDSIEHARPGSDARLRALAEAAATLSVACEQLRALVNEPEAPAALCAQEP